MAFSPLSLPLAGLSGQVSGQGANQPARTTSRSGARWLGPEGRSQAQQPGRVLPQNLVLEPVADRQPPDRLDRLRRRLSAGIIAA